MDTRSEKILLTDSTKIKRLGHNIFMYWTNFWQPTAYVKQNIFENALIEACSPNIYASFGTFCVEIGQLCETQWVFEVCFKIDKSLLSKENILDFGNLLDV